jgi:Flp pilus assembly protein TadD
MLQMPCTPRVLRRLAPPLTAAAIALLAGACAGSHQEAARLAGPLMTSREAADASGPPAGTHAGATEAKASPAEPAALLDEARGLRRAGDKKGAFALLEQASALHPGDRTLMKERGLLAVELGHVAQGKDLLHKAMDPSAPDWRLYSALGTALAASGQQQEAQAQFAKALELAPDHPAVLNNLALSYALDGKHEQAERLLRRVSDGGAAGTAKAQAEQNLALILGLSGRTAEARRVSEATLPAAQAEANMAYLQKLPAAGKASPAADAVPVRSAHATGLPAPTYQLGGARE